MYVYGKMCWNRCKHNLFGMNNAKVVEYIIANAVKKLN